VPDNFITEAGRNHISVDNVDLLNEISEYKERLKLHIKNVEILPHIIDSTIKSKFIEAGIYPVRTGNYEDIGYYHFGDVNMQLNVTWDNFLTSGRNIEAFVRRYNFNGLQFNEDQGYLKLGGFVVGRGNNEQRIRMRQILNEIPRNHFILNALNNLMNNKLDLDRRAQRIRNMATPLSQAITDREYRTVNRNCCPTHDPSIWNFG
jgi:hypothetical protein